MNSVAVPISWVSCSTIASILGNSLVIWVTAYRPSLVQERVGFGSGRAARQCLVVGICRSFIENCWGDYGAIALQFLKHLPIIGFTKRYFFMHPGQIKYSQSSRTASSRTAPSIPSIVNCDC